MIATRFFEWYKTKNKLIKILLCWILLIMAVFWLIGSLTYVDRLIMFITGIITGGVLMFIYYEQIYSFIERILFLWQKLN